MKVDSEVVLYGESEVRVVTSRPENIHELRHDDGCRNRGLGRWVVSRSRRTYRRKKKMSGSCTR